MLLRLYKNLKSLPANNKYAAFAVKHTPLAIELLATAWVILNYSFDPVIPVYQGY